MDRCTCPTCCVVKAWLQGALVARGWPREAADTLTINAGTDGPHAALAHVMVGNREVYRIHERPDEALDPDVLDDIEAALRLEASCS